MILIPERNLRQVHAFRWLDQSEFANLLFKLGFSLLSSLLEIGRVLGRGMQAGFVLAVLQRVAELLADFLVRPLLLEIPLPFLPLFGSRILGQPIIPHQPDCDLPPINAGQLS